MTAAGHIGEFPRGNAIGRGFALPHPQERIAEEDEPVDRRQRSQHDHHNGDDLRGGALHIADTEITLGQRHFQRDGLQVQKTVG